MADVSCVLTRWVDKKNSLFEKGFNLFFFFTRSKPNYVPQTICHNSQTHHVNWRNKIILIVVEIIFLLDNLSKHPFCHSLLFTLQPILMNFIYFVELFHLLQTHLFFFSCLCFWCRFKNHYLE